VKRGGDGAGAVIEAGRNVGVEETAGFALAKACRAHRVNVGAALAGIGLHVGQEMVLLELWKEDGLKGGELAARLRVEPPTVTRMLQRLEGCGSRRAPQGYRGCPQLSRLSHGEGARARGPVRERWGQVEERAFRGMSEEEKTLLRGQLARIRENLDAV
jgi:DNA-binding MarR family transcriptional regulator